VVGTKLGTVAERDFCLAIVLAGTRDRSVLDITSGLPTNRTQSRKPVSNEAVIEV
jgi:hypothetical protein